MSTEGPSSGTNETAAGAGAPQAQPTPPTEQPAKAKKPRSPVERTIVWGAIAVLLVLIAAQGFAYYGYEQSRRRIKSAINKVDSESNKYLTLDRAEELLDGYWLKSDIKSEGRVDYVTYRWPAVVVDYRILLHLNKGGKDGNKGGKDRLVLSYSTNTEDPDYDKLLAETRKAPPKPAEGGAENNDSQDGQSDETGQDHGQAGGGGGPGNGQGGNFDPFENDADEDGKLSREEVSERMLQFFDRLDENGDDFIDADEWQAARERRAARREAGGGPNGDGPQPQDGQDNGDAAPSQEQDGQEEPSGEEDEAD